MTITIASLTTSCIGCGTPRNGPPNVCFGYHNPVLNFMVFYNNKKLFTGCVLSKTLGSKLFTELSIYKLFAAHNIKQSVL
jgi:hypothetical protein